MLRVKFSGVFSRILVTILMMAGVATINGCATVVMEGAGGVKSVSVERDALKIAAAAVSQSEWPKPSSVSLGERLTGIVAVKDERRITKKDAVLFYVNMLAETPDPEIKVLADAERQLQAADRLAVAAENAADAVRPTMSDVAIVEGAIASLRQSRDIYLASLDRIETDVRDTDQSRRIIKEDFNRSITEIGRAADVLADRVANDRTRTIAQPSVRSNFSGSL